MLTSSQDHPSAIVLTLDHYRLTTSLPQVNREDQVAEVTAQIYSGFGNTDIQPDSWQISIVGENEGFEAATFTDPEVVNETDDYYQIKFGWLYNDDQAPSDNYWITISVKDIQGNTWTQLGEVPLILIVHNKMVNLKVSPDGLLVNGQASFSKVVADKAVTISATIEATGDPSITRNPVEWSIYVNRLGSQNRTIIEAGQIVHLPPETSQEVSVQWTPPQTGEYLISIALDESNVVPETREDDNGAEMVVEVLDEEGSRISAFFNDLRDDPMVAGLFALALIATVLLIVMAVVVVRRGGGRYSSSAEDDDWDDDF